MNFIAVVAALGIFVFASRSHADEQDEGQRLAAEAAALFRVVMAAEAPPKQCQYGLTWSTMPIPDYVARKYLGLTLHADLSAPQQDTDLRETLDPKKQHADAFCNEGDSAAFEKGQFEAFENDKAAKQVVVESTSFTLPVFDAGYSRAIVIISRSALERDRLALPMGPFRAGNIMRHPGTGVDLANVYVKTKTGWALIASEVIGQS